MTIHIHHIGQVWYFEKKDMTLLGQITHQRYHQTDFEVWYSSDNSQEDIEAYNKAVKNAKKRNDDLYQRTKRQLWY